MAPVRLVVALVFGLAAPGAALAQASLVESVPHITVIGHARSEVVPDLVTLSLAVVTERPKAAAAAAANAQAAQAVIETIKGNGIDPQDVQTSEVSLTPVYDSLSDAEGRGTGQKLRGYQARNGLTVRVRDVGKAGALAARLIDSGANEFQGISYSARDEDAIYAKLNAAAMQDALRRAKAYLPAAGVSLGRVLEIAPNDQGGIEPRVFAKAMAPMANVPMTPGTLPYESQVRVTWELVAH